MTGKMLHGYLDHLRDNLETLDEQIVNARKMSKNKGKDSNALQWAKTSRDLVELRNTTLANIKVHLLGRDETGSEWEFERDFKRFLGPWTQKDIEFECVDCGVESEEVYRRTFSHPYPQDDEHFYLCDKYYEKRTAKDTDKSEEVSEASDPVSILKELAKMQGGKNASSRMSGAVTGAVRNVIKLIRSDGRSATEKVRTLEEFKAKVSQTADSNGSGDMLESGLALLNREIERLKGEGQS